MGGNERAGGMKLPLLNCYCTFSNSGDKDQVSSTAQIVASGSQTNVLACFLYIYIFTFSHLKFQHCQSDHIQRICLSGCCCYAVSGLTSSCSGSLSYRVNRTSLFQFQTHQIHLGRKHGQKGKAVNVQSKVSTCCREMG